MKEFLMSHSTKRWILAPLAQALVLGAIAGSGGAALAADSAAASRCMPRLDPVESRLYSRYHEGGMDRLYHYMYINRTMLQRSIYETGVWAEAIETQRALCTSQLEQSMHVASAR
jgi:hypothetical protein